MVRKRTKILVFHSPKLDDGLFVWAVSTSTRAVSYFITTLKMLQKMSWHLADVLIVKKG